MTSCCVYARRVFTTLVHGDKKAAGSGSLRYYSACATSAMYVLENDLSDTDWGLLPEGAVIDAVYNNLVFGPEHKGARWYTPSAPPIKVTIPVEHLLHASFAMAPAVAAARASGMAKAALAKGARVLSEHDHLQAMDALAWA